MRCLPITNQRQPAPDDWIHVQVKHEFMAEWIPFKQKFILAATSNYKDCCVFTDALNVFDDDRQCVRHDALGCVALFALAACVSHIPTFLWSLSISIHYHSHVEYASFFLFNYIALPDDSTYFALYILQTPDPYMLIISWMPVKFYVGLLIPVRFSAPGFPWKYSILSVPVVLFLYY